MADAATRIKKVAVIGAGVMGGGIAAQMADAGVEVDFARHGSRRSAQTATRWPRPRSRNRWKAPRRASCTRAAPA